MVLVLLLLLALVRVSSVDLALLVSLVLLILLLLPPPLVTEMLAMFLDLDLDPLLLLLLLLVLLESSLLLLLLLLVLESLREQLEVESLVEEVLLCLLWLLPIRFRSVMSILLLMVPVMLLILDLLLLPILGPLPLLLLGLLLLLEMPTMPTRLLVPMSMPSLVPASPRSMTALPPTLLDLGLGLDPLLLPLLHSPRLIRPSPIPSFVDDLRSLARSCRLPRALALERTEAVLATDPRSRPLVALLVLRDPASLHPSPAAIQSSPLVLSASMPLLPPLRSMVTRAPATSSTREAMEEEQGSSPTLLCEVSLEAEVSLELPEVLLEVEVSLEVVVLLEVVELLLLLLLPVLLLRQAVFVLETLRTFVSSMVLVVLLLDRSVITFNHSIRPTPEQPREREREYDRERENEPATLWSIHRDTRTTLACSSCSTSCRRSPMCDTH